MNKLLLLLFIPLVFNCSSDSSDDEDNTLETFLERYDGVIWQNEILTSENFLTNENVGGSYDENVSLQENIRNAHYIIFNYESNSSSSEYDWLTLVMLDDITSLNSEIYCYNMPSDYSASNHFGITYGGWGDYFSITEHFIPGGMIFSQVIVFNEGNNLEFCSSGGYGGCPFPLRTFTRYPLTPFGDPEFNCE